MELHQKEVSLSFRKRFFTGGWWAWKRLFRAVGMASAAGFEEYLDNSCRHRISILCVPM